MLNDEEPPHSLQVDDVPQLLNQNDLNNLLKNLGLQGKIGAFIFKIDTMEYDAEKSLLHLFAFQTRKCTRFFFCAE